MGCSVLLGVNIYLGIGRSILLSENICLDTVGRVGKRQNLVGVAVANLETAQRAHFGLIGRVCSDRLGLLRGGSCQSPRAWALIRRLRSEGWEPKPPIRLRSEDSEQKAASRTHRAEGWDPKSPISLRSEDSEPKAPIRGFRSEGCEQQAVNRRLRSEGSDRGSDQGSDQKAPSRRLCSEVSDQKAVSHRVPC